MLYTIMYKKFGFPLIQKMLGRPTVAMAEGFRASASLPGDAIRHKQLLRLDELYRHARSTIPMYRELYREGPERIESFEQFSALPVLDRHQVSKHHAAMVADGVRGSEVLISRTGGSSGEPLTFYASKGSAPLGLAMMMRARAWWGVDYNERNALFIEHGLKFEDNWRARAARSLHHFRERLLNRVFFSAYRMSDADMQGYYEALLRFKPVYLIGYASFLYLFARYLHERNLPAKPLGVNCIFYTSEMLYPWQRSVIEEVFGCQVVGEYGLKEVGVVAYECAARRWHTMDESVYVEVVPLSGTPGYGEIVVTQLMNTSSPFIRYRTGDIAALVDMDKACPCGRGLHVMGAIHGRSHDWIITPSGKALHGQIFTHALIVRGTVKKFRVHQAADHSVRIQAVVSTSFGDEEERLILKNLSEVIGEPLSITFERLEHLPAGSSGKFRWIRSDISVYERSEHGSGP